MRRRSVLTAATVDVTGRAVRDLMAMIVIVRMPVIVMVMIVPMVMTMIMRMIVTATRAVLVHLGVDERRRKLPLERDRHLAR